MRLLAGILLLGLSTSGITQAAQTQAAEGKKLIYTECLSAHSERPSTIFKGYILADQFAWSTNNISIVGRPRGLFQHNLENPKCSKTYTYQVCHPQYGCSWYTAQRNWNSLQIGLKGSTLYLNCSPTSVVEVFDTKQDWAEDVLSNNVGSEKILESQVSDRSCIVYANDLEN